MLYKRKNASKQSIAVSEIIGTVILLAITVALFSVIYVVISPFLIIQDSPQVNIVGYVEENKIILEHHGGDSLDPTTQLQFTINGQQQIVSLNSSVLYDTNNNGKWDVGENVVYDAEPLSGYEVNAFVIDSSSNSAIFFSTLQSGVSNGSITIDTTTSVNEIIPYIQTSSPLTVTATGDSRLSSVELWYRYSSDNQSWNGDTNWWSASWSKRKAINLQTPSGSTPTNYQILINITYDSDMNSNFSDLRFIDYTDNTTQLAYWIEDKDNGNWAQIWVKNENNITTANQTHIWMYYGNPSATSNSNGENTFEFFDDFIGTTLDTNKWQINADSYTVSNSILQISIGAVSIKDALSFNINDGYTLEGKIRYPSLASHYSGTLSAQSSHYTQGSNHGADATSLYMRQDNSRNVYRWTGTGSSSSYNCGSGTVFTSIDNTWYILGSNFDNTGVTLTKDRTSEWTYTCGWTKNIKYISLGSFYGASDYNIQDTEYDWVLIRKYTSNEPSVSIGSEEERSDTTSWELFGVDTSSPWQWNFNFPDGQGYYEFYSIGKYGENSENASVSADAMCHYSSSSVPISYWRFDENSGTIARDSIGNNDGTITGATWTTGVNGSALRFDGVDDYVHVPHSDDFNITNNLTLEVWIKPAGSGKALGDIANDSIDSFIFGSDGGENAKIIKISESVYAVTFEDWNSDGWVKTVEIRSNGSITEPTIDALEFDTSKGTESDILHVTGDIYAIAYRGSNNDGFIKTVEIKPNGTIGNSIIDMLEFDTSNAHYPEIAEVSDNIFAIAYQGSGNDGFLSTVEINDNGTIGDSVIDTYEFDTSNGREPDILQVTGNIFSIAYRGSGNDGYIITTEIFSNGTISKSVKDSLEFDTSNCHDPDLIHIAGDIFAIAYAHDWGEGYVKTIEINDIGSITNTVVDSYQFEGTTTAYCDIIHVSRDVYAISHLGPNDDGFVKTITIQTNGTITSSIIDSLEFDTQKGFYPRIIHVSNDIYAVSYTDNAWQGHIKTIEINSNRGITKNNAFGIDFTSSLASAFINNNSISASISNGWNYVVLTYDKSASSNQQKLYINGTLRANSTLTEDINLNSNELFFGRYVDGWIDEIAIYDKTLTQSEIRARYNQLKP